MGSSSAQHQQSGRRAVSSSWSDYRDFDSTGSSQPPAQLPQPPIGPSGPSSGLRSSSGLKVRSSSYDQEYYQDVNYISGGGPSRGIVGRASEGGLPVHHQHPPTERTLPVVHHPPHQQQHQQQHHHQRQQQSSRHPHHHPQHHHHHHHHPHHRHHQSSSEEELRSTSECTSCEDVEVESESVSEKGKFFFSLYSFFQAERYAL